MTQLGSIQKKYRSSSHNRDLRGFRIDTGVAPSRTIDCTAPMNLKSLAKSGPIEFDVLTIPGNELCSAILYKNDYILKFYGWQTMLLPLQNIRFIGFLRDQRSVLCPSRTNESIGLMLYGILMYKEGRRRRPENF